MDCDHTRKDWVCEELKLALQHKKEIIPLLLNGTPPPTAAELPPSIHKLAYQQGHRVYDESSKDDIEALIEKLELSVAPTWARSAPESIAHTPPRGRAGYLAAGLALGGLLAPFWLVPDQTSARKAAVSLALWSLALLLAPLAAVLGTFLTKKPVNLAEQSVHDMPAGGYFARVAGPLGVLGVLLTLSFLVGQPVSPSVVPFLIFIVIIVTVYLVVLIRNQLKNEEKRRRSGPSNCGNRSALPPSAKNSPASTGSSATGQVIGRRGSCSTKPTGTCNTCGMPVQRCRRKPGGAGGAG
ncbi:MAG TPA: hypothetical protein VLJ59_10630 [Mycobacteriales bacterium]|nr:hypothetical protein [Mycobacteriales bacterium]